MKNKQTPGKAMSAQEQFIKKHKRHHHSVACIRLIMLAAFLILWECAANYHIIDSFFFSSPSRVTACFLSMCRDYSIFRHIGVTLLETLLSFFLVIFIGLFSATLLWCSKSLSEIMEPYLVVLNSLPKSALAPLFIVWLGTGMNTIIVAGISVALFGCIISLYTGFHQVDAEKIKLIYTLGGVKKDVFTKVILPSSVPTILSTMKVNIGLALVGVIIGEFLAARQGLGYLIIYGSQVFQLHLVITSILILCVIAMGLYQLIQWAEHCYKKRL